jgi:glycosyltransferase involved in cell wall biosynthesis
MRIIIIADDRKKEGGTNEVIKHITRALENHQIFVEYLDSEKYFPKFLPKKWKDLFRIFYLTKLSRADFSKFDIAITLQPDSHCIKHSNHIIYFQHYIKQYYELFWQSLRQKSSLRRKIMFIIIAILCRIADKIFLSPRLKKSHVLVNSHTVGQRILRYSGISNFSILYPGCKDNKELMHAYTSPKKIDNNNNDSQEKSNIPLLLSFSRLSWMQKGINVILDTASLATNYQFIIAGPYDDATIKTVQQKSLFPKNVQLIVKEFTEAQKTELFDKCDVFLAPYIEEDFGITPLEANAYGKPVIYCEDSGEIKLTQKHKETGFMCKRNPESIMVGIGYCIEHKEQMKPACIENATKYPWDKFEKGIQDYINKLETVF